MKKKKENCKKKQIFLILNMFTYVVTSRAMCCTSVMYNKAKGDAIIVMSLGEN